MSDELDVFAEQMAALRGALPRLAAALREAAVDSLLRWNIYQAHIAALGYKAHSVKHSEYLTMRGDTIRVGMGGEAESLVATSRSVLSASTQWVAVDDERKINYWPDAILDSSKALGDLEGAPGQFPREDAVHWLDAVDWRDGCFYPILSLNVVALARVMHAPVSLVERAGCVAYSIREYVSSPRGVRVDGFSTTDDEHAALLSSQGFRRLETSDEDFDQDRITLRIGPTATDQGDVDFLGRPRSFENPLLLIDII